MQSNESAPKKLVDETIKIYQSLIGFSGNERQLARPNFNVVHELIRKVSKKLDCMIDKNIG